MAAPDGVRLDLWQRIAGPPAQSAGTPQVLPAVMCEVLAGAPRQLRILWELAEGAGQGWGWLLTRAGDGPVPDAWTLAISAPDGTITRCTWVRAGDRLRLTAQTATSRAPAA